MFVRDEPNGSPPSSRRAMFVDPPLPKCVGSEMFTWNLMGFRNLAGRVFYRRSTPDRHFYKHGTPDGVRNFARRVSTNVTPQNAGPSVTLLNVTLIASLK